MSQPFFPNQPINRGAQRAPSGAGLPAAAPGFFRPGTVFWLVNREAPLMLGGIRPLLMQMAHPKVAQGVANHSRFEQDPLGRARRTFETVHAILFGTQEEALGAAARMQAVHRRVRGQLSELPPGMADPRYDATDPRLQLWVYATLVDSAMVMYQQLYPALPPEAWEEYYQESKVFARICGIDEAVLPDRLADLQRWMEQMIASDEIAVTRTAQAIARALFRGPPLARLLFPLNYLLAARLLPPKLRAAFGLRWNRPIRWSSALLLQLARLVVRLLPRRLRMVPRARQAERRWQAYLASRQ